MPSNATSGTPAPRANPGLAASAAALAAGRIASGLISLGSAMVLSRLLSQHLYGTYQQMWLIYNTVVPLMLIGLPASVTYFVPQLDARGQKMVVLQTAALLMGAGLVVSVATTLAAGPLSAGFRGRALLPLLHAFFLFPIFTLPLTFVDALLVATGRAAAAAWFNMISAGIQFASVALPVALGLPLPSAVQILSAASVLRFLGIAGYVLREYRGVPLMWDRSFLVRQLRYSVPLGLSSVLGTLTLQLDRLMIAAWFGPRDYAVYVNGATELPFVGIIAGSVMSVVTPEFVRLYGEGRTEAILRLWHSATRRVAVILFPLTALLMAFGPDLVVLLFSQRYAESAPLFRIFLLLLPLRITVYGALLMAAGLSALILRAAVATLALNALLNVTLIPLLGMPGAAVATVTATYTMAFWQLDRCARLLAVPLREILPWSALGRLGAGAAAAGAAAALAASPLPAGGIRLAAGSLLFLLAAAPLIARSGARSELAAVMRRVRGGSR